MEQWKTPVILILAAVCLWLFFEPVRSKTESHEVIVSDAAPEAIGPYSQGIRSGNTLWFSGQIGLDPETGELSGDIESQTRQVFRNLQAVGDAAGFSLGDVVAVEVYLADIGHYQAFNEIYAEYFEEDPPARAVVEVSELPRGALVEVKMTAVR